MAEKLIRASQVDLSEIEDSLELLQNQVESEQEALTQEILERKNADDEIKVNISDLEQGLSDLEENKQNKLIAGTNIFINPETNVISASGGSGGGVWGTIIGDIQDQTDLQNALDSKQEVGDYALKSELPTIAAANKPGLVAGGNWLTVNQQTGKMECGQLTKEQYNSALGYTFISKTTLENRIVDKQDALNITLLEGATI